MEADRSLQKEARLNRFFDRFEEDSPYALDILKGHLLIEETLEEIVLSVCRDPTSALEARMGFYTKIKLAQAIDGRESSIWRCLDKLNLARNELAHGRDRAILEKKIDSFIDCVRQAYAPKSMQSDRLFNLTVAIVTAHAALSRVAADHTHA